MTSRNALLHRIAPAGSGAGRFFSSRSAPGGLAWAPVWALALALPLMAALGADEMQLTLRDQRETSPGSGRFHVRERSEAWGPSRTALVVCDVWDYHHCWNAVQRLNEFGPRLNRVVQEARRRGVTIIHAPSDCMDAYREHPARRRAQQALAAAKSPPPRAAAAWCSRIPSEERADYPIDQSDGGEDDEPQQHARWAAHLESLGRNPNLPWKAQSDLIEIDRDRDYISDRGDEVWSILEQQGIERVILTGVHCNMCVLGRPFGLRQARQWGKDVVLMRDMTDSMYNPQRWPYVSHYSGNDLVISHVERFVCPTISSDQLIGGKEFRFRDDRRPHLVMLIAEDEYETERTLPRFAASRLNRDFRVSYVWGSERERHRMPGLQRLADADVVLVSVRRRGLPPEDLDVLRRFVAAGKPVVGIRTASHAFSVKDLPEPFAQWPSFDADVWGGNYHGHYPNDQSSEVRLSTAGRHPVLMNWTSQAVWRQTGSLYKAGPLARGAQLIATARLVVDGVDASGAPAPEEPVAWTFHRADGGRSFYTSLGHKDDFETAEFSELLERGIRWAAGLPSAGDAREAPPAPYEDHWATLQIPGSWKAARGTVWLRCAVRAPQSWAAGAVKIQLPSGARGWLNGAAIEQGVAPSSAVAVDDANLLVIQLPSGARGLDEAPEIQHGASRFPLRGRWQMRVGANEAWSNMPLPAKFGAPTDILFVPE